MNVHLSVIAHTNVGKTTLLRTLLRRDIGEVADRPHVTEIAERHALVETPEGDTLFLWDTPGFGDSARLLSRLANIDNPIGWLQTQVWDRFVDRPFFCSQQAIVNARRESDVVLYLVNAAEGASAAPYVEAELAILAWLGKPVLLLLNQTGAPRAPEAQALEEAQWNKRLAAHVRAQGSITLDAFARCWVQEDRLLGATLPLVAAEKQPAFERLRAAWRERNLEVFRRSMHAMGEELARIAADAVEVPEKLDAGSFAERLRRLAAGMRDGRREPDPAVEAAMQTLAKRVERLASDTTQELVTLHGLSGEAPPRIMAVAEAHYSVAMPMDVASGGLLGGMLSGAAGGLAADLATGGLSLGAGVAIGTILGLLGGGGAVHAYNVLRGQEDGRVRWSEEFLIERARAALLRYLAVAHFGRGRGQWSETEAPAHWHALVVEATATDETAWREAFRIAAAQNAPAAATFEALLARAARELLRRLYPESASLLEPVM